jgi:ACR3 family arsenite transporter
MEPPLSPEPPPQESDPAHPLGVFGRYLTVWVVVAGVLGMLVGYYAPSVTDTLDQATVSQISVPVAILIWLMVYPMVVQVDLAAIRAVRSNLKPLMVTSSINYLVQPFTMYALARLFFDVAFKSTIDDDELRKEYLAGAIILGGSPCTAMVFVWSYLVHGDPAYTLVQVAVNDLLIFVFYIPTLMLLLEVTNIPMPWDTAFLAVALFLVVPGLMAVATQRYAALYRDQAWLDWVVEAFAPVTKVALLGTIFLIFIFQGKQIFANPIHVLLIAVPLTLQTLVVFAMAFGSFYALRVPHKLAAPGALIATSNFFELAVAVAMALFGADSGATLATVVGVLTEVPIMLTLVWVANKMEGVFDRRSGTTHPGSNSEGDCCSSSPPGAVPISLQPAKVLYVSVV